MTPAQILTGFLRAQDAQSLSFDPADLTRSDWEEVIRLAKEHRLAPQFFVRLNKLDKLSDLPAESAQRLRNMYLSSVARGLQLSSELAEILDHFNKTDIPVIVLKGPHLAEMVYKDWALRPMGDFDLMVKKEDLARAAEGLKVLGYEASAEFHLEAQIKFHNDLPMLSKQNGFIVDPHWTLELPTSPFKIDIEGVWQRARKTTISGTDALVLSPEDFLLHLCIHAAYHHRLSFGLLLLRDIAETIQCLRGEIDWEKLINTAEQWGAGRCLSLSLYLSKELFAAEAPSEVLKKDLFSDSDLNISEIARERIFGTSAGNLPLTHNISRLWGERGFWDKAEIFLKNAFPSTYALAAIYPVNPSSKRIYLYYPVRLKDLLVLYGKTVFSLFRRDAHTIEQIKKEEQGNILVDWLTAEEIHL